MLYNKIEADLIHRHAKTQKLVILTSEVSGLDPEVLALEYFIVMASGRKRKGILMLSKC
jgi:hypothetical protein